LGEHSLPVVLHPLAQAGTEGVHFLARRSGGVEVQHRVAHKDLPANQGCQINAGRLNIRAHCASGELGGSEGLRVLRDLLALNQGYMPAAAALEIPRVAFDAFAGHDADALDVGEAFPTLGRMQVQ
jgi:hypothetical protein